jgi:hypothetical protein
LTWFASTLTKAGAHQVTVTITVTILLHISHGRRIILTGIPYRWCIFIVNIANQRHYSILVKWHVVSSANILKFQNHLPLEDCGAAPHK